MSPAVPQPTTRRREHIVVAPNKFPLRLGGGKDKLPSASDDGQEHGVCPDAGNEQGNLGWDVHEVLPEDAEIPERRITCRAGMSANCAKATSTVSAMSPSAAKIASLNGQGDGHIWWTHRTTAVMRVMVCRAESLERSIQPGVYLIRDKHENTYIGAETGYGENAGWRGRKGSGRRCS
ncbi:hypothetical protein PLEOSDRAFT_171519 [Pleurotus ostreatus PC15]|uniref:Uncharacterized protein n=1 Tax=Pleurotus ostreatus (strain PC15) TaxID=1137138 RepID=A0A067NG05_PLEO1|nr:hypothetical protein PLEOSDRAFT_171519 [Pleurotus ostreatus PC15]